MLRIAGSSAYEPKEFLNELNSQEAIETVFPLVSADLLLDCDVENHKAEKKKNLCDLEIYFACPKKGSRGVEFAASTWRIGSPASE